jgi:hypothetical protein
MDPHFLLALAYAGMGWKDAAKAEIARSKEKLDDWGTAVLFGNLGEADPALPALERIAAERWSNHNGWHLHPQFDSLRNDPRFQKLVAGNRRL